MEYYDQLNNDIPPKEKDSIFNLTEYDTDDLDDSNKILADNLIDIYKQANCSSCEFIDVKFTLNLFPPSLLELSFITTLTIKNSNINSIELLPPNVETFCASDCNISSISYDIFTPVLKDINLSNNKLNKFICNSEYIEYIDIGSNKIQYVELVTPKLKLLEVQNNYLKTHEFINNNTTPLLENLDISRNSIDELFEFNDELQILNVSKNTLTEINIFPKKIKELIAYSNKFTEFNLEKAPPTLYKLDLYNNYIEYISDIPNNLRWLDVGANDLKKIPKNIQVLEYFDISGNDRINLLNDSEGEQFRKIKENNLNFHCDDLENQMIENENNKSSESEIEEICNINDYFENITSKPKYNNVDDISYENLDDIFNINHKPQIENNYVNIKRYVKLYKTFVI